MTYIIQGLYEDGRIAEEDEADNRQDARDRALTMLRSPFFEGSKVRVITEDGELVTNRLFG